ncbi:bifunctional diguanylate cyclase/phosphodiesterase [Sporosarcina sp. Te-1]|uniref:putative bifunctional diguanylate cyclase/phosphodiesterase n=1 Tax=Sporosarcina sp. Te-1 TaxID=2818390 RepID=UPI001A9EBE7F|nr:EAL domain-containing protein [Sporosarcina sp. Te-1]QTD40673.1 EAL domain-containing protein [Sporosarcina sp. Te-1]
MGRITNAYLDGRLWVLILAVIILPNAMEELLSQMFKWEFDNVIWYEIVDTAVFVVFAAPIFAYMIKRMDLYAHQLEHQLAVNSKASEQLKLMNEELSYNAYHDDLTLLPNRRQLFRKLDQSTKEDDVSAVLFLDLDRFKVINDTLGHLYGDIFIRQVGKRLRDRLPQNYKVFRHGGDEFIVLLKNTNRFDAERMASNLLTLFSEPFIVNEEEIFSTASIGICLFPEDGKDAETLLKNADKAMYASKEKGGNTYSFYSAKTAVGDVRKMKLENGLRTAVDSGQLELHYQPIINLFTNRTEAVEALIRWHHPELGFIPPNEFITIAEKTGAIIPLGKWVLETACGQVKDWQQAGFPNMSVAVNVSIRQINEPGFVEFVKDVLRRTGLSPAFLDIEITESMMQNDESIIILHELKKIGIKISIDDFGTGYSSLSVLGYLPIDRLKIDQSFTQEMLRHPHTNSIVKTIIDMGRNLGLTLVAEGIEEETQAQALQNFGCNFGQGYFYNRPLTVDQMQACLQGEYRAQ